MLKINFLEDTELLSGKLSKNMREKRKLSCGAFFKEKENNLFVVCWNQAVT